MHRMDRKTIDSLIGTLYVDMYTILDRIGFQNFCWRRKRVAVVISASV